MKNVGSPRSEWAREGSSPSTMQSKEDREARSSIYRMRRLIPWRSWRTRELLWAGSDCCDHFPWKHICIHDCLSRGCLKLKAPHPQLSQGMGSCSTSPAQEAKPLLIPLRKRWLGHGLFMVISCKATKPSPGSVKPPKLVCGAAGLGHIGVPAAPWASDSDAPSAASAC